MITRKSMSNKLCDSWAPAPLKGENINGLRNLNEICLAGP